MVTRSVIRITAAEAAAAKVSPSKMGKGAGNTFTNNKNEGSSSRQSPKLPRSDMKRDNIVGEADSIPSKEVASKELDGPITEELTRNIESKKRGRSNTIDLSDVPPQSPIPKDKTDGRMKDKASKYTGVSWDKIANKWLAQISIEGKRRHIGCYDNEEEAGTDYARAVYKYKRNKKPKKRQRSNSFTIDLSDVPPLSPIPKNKRDLSNSNDRRGGQMNVRASKYIGVAWNKKMNKWYSRFFVEGKQRLIGNYKNEEEAGSDYARAMFKYRGKGKETLVKGTKETGIPGDSNSNPPKEIVSEKSEVLAEELTSNKN